MQALRDVAFGAVTWFFALGSLGTILVLGTTYLGPPIQDRARSFAFIMGGGMTLLLLAIAAGVFAAIYISQRS